MGGNTKTYEKCLLILYVLCLMYWMFWGFDRTINENYMYNLVPFSTLKVYVESEHINIYDKVINILGNIGVFISFGILIPSIFRARLLKTLIITQIGLLILESVQLVTRRGCFDVDDFLLNTVGVIIGYFFIVLLI